MSKMGKNQSINDENTEDYEVLDLPIRLYSAMEDFFYSPERFKILLAGRRTGKTVSLIYFILQQMLMNTHKRFMFIDLSYSQIGLYYDKFIRPVLAQIPQKMWEWKQRDQVLYLNNNILRFKSYTKPETIVGDHMDVCVVNECSAVLEREKILNNTIMPMLIDSHDSQLVLVGTPIVGMSTGYRELYERVKNNPRWLIRRMSSYENPYLSKESVDDIVSILDDDAVKVEIYAEFPSASTNSFYYNFEHSKHISEVKPAGRHVCLSFDFNIRPITVLVFETSVYGIKVIKEFSINDSDISAVCKIIIDYMRIHSYTIDSITGDASGKNFTALRSNINFYTLIANELKLAMNQIRVPSSNMNVKNSRLLCNAMLSKPGMVAVDSGCKHLIRSFMNLKVDLSGDQIKDDVVDHASDAFRYIVNNYYPHILNISAEGKKFVI